MKLPDSVNVFGKEIIIIECHPCKDDDGNSVDGTYDARSSTICIDSKSPSEDKIHSLLHELGHAMVQRVSIGQTEISSDVEEMIVNNMATLMTEIFNLRFRRKK